MSEAIRFEDGTILVDLASVQKSGSIGYPGTAKDDNAHEEKAEKSSEAINKAMQTVYQTAQRMNEMLGQLEESKLEEVELEFALSLKDNGDVLIAKGGSEAQFRVKLTWET